LLTVERRIVAGRVARKGGSASYRALAGAEGEKHIVRTDLSGSPGRDVDRHVRPLLTLAHLSDLHVTDVESPARFEYLNRYAGDLRFRELLTMQRPQEALNAHAIEALVRAVNSVEAAPVGGRPVQLTVMTGDAIDNTQSNELANFVALFDGLTVHPKSGGQTLESVQVPSWPSDLFWKPESGSGSDRFRKRYGFPHVPGLLERASRDFAASGLGMPWLGCYGNHEQVLQGVGIINRAVAAAMVGGQKPVAPPPHLAADTAVEAFTRTPDLFMSGPTVAVTPDRGRASARLTGFLEAMLGSETMPNGHGFGPANRQGNANYVYDTAPVRFICLDTVSRAGGADGRVNQALLDWLEDRLIEVHSAYTDRRGRTVTTSNDNKLVVLMSHHPYVTLNNSREQDTVENRQLLHVLHRYGNVILWLNGHVHMNAVRPHPNREGVTVGFWEVTTGSLVDWPCQGRLVEILDAGYGRVAVACTMLDHEGPVDPGEASSLIEMAGLHRELAANDPLAGMGSPRAGTPEDRNVILALPAPFNLKQIHRQ
jgi:metallophosphoesterase (TIGR03767 family)